MWLNVLASVISIAAFLGGLHVMRTGLEGMAGGRLPILLHRIARTPTRGIATGLVVTSLLQSSAAVTAIVVGMVAGGSMIFRDALSIVLGANVGSTITPQLLTLNLWGFVIPCIVLGIVGFASRRPQLVHPSMACVGFGSIFIALESLTVALEPITRTTWFANWLQAAGQNSLYAVAIGCVASAMFQSSTATTVMTMALASKGVVPLPGAISIVLGANVGTCLTSVIAAIGQSRPAQQVALSHVLLNVGGVLVTLPFIDWYAKCMTWFSAQPAQQIANAHTVFNVLSTVLVWPFTNAFAHLIERLLPDHRQA